MLPGLSHQLERYNVHVEFEWDDEKAASNEVKHNVAFEEAKTVFTNPLAVIFDDEDHSDDEARELIIGHSYKNRLLVISLTERSNLVRIISARKATRNERKDYEDYAFR